MFSFLKPDRVVPEWEYSAGSYIWRMLLSERGGLVAECRDPERKVTSFFCLELSTGKVVWKDLKLDEPWWVGMEAVQKNVVLLHEFATPDMPAHRGIRAIDAASGTLLWQKDDVVYWFGHGDRVITYRDFFERRVGYELDLQSGVLLKTHDPSLEELHLLRRKAAEEQALPDVTLPEILVEEEVDLAITGLVRKETKGKELSGRIEYIVRHDVLLFNFHVQKRDNTVNAKLENNFVVYRLPDKRRLFADVIGRNLAAYVPDSFFVKDSFALFVKDRTVLTALRLWKS